MNKLIDRVKAILVNPKPTWEIIKSEPTSVKKLYMEYLVPLAAIPAVAMFIGGSLIGVQAGIFGSYRVPIATGLTSAVLSYVLTLAGVFVAAKVIDLFAPTFGATRNDLNAFKVAAYAMTPALAAGVLNIIPVLGILVILAALYGIYLLYLGLQSLMNCPPEKAVGYTAVSILVLAGVYIVIGLIVGAVTGMGMSAHGTGFSR